MGILKVYHLIVVLGRNRHFRNIKVDVVDETSLDVLVDGAKGLSFVFGITFDVKESAQLRHLAAIELLKELESFIIYLFLDVSKFLLSQLQELNFNDLFLLLCRILQFFV